ncbi:MAG: peptide deformylase [Patescibacteria group bacterium]|nr:peptide deformylase [Patescibacteria group bacterium]
MLKIITVPNSILSSPTKPVIDFDKKLEKIIEEMKITLEAQTDPPGVGLAANQVGINLSLFIIKPTKKSKIEIFANPKIIKTIFQKNYSSKKIPEKKNLRLEGCLSIPKIWGPIKRAQKILLEYQDIKGKKQIKWFSGFKAVIIQHEVDHLNGILFTQRSIEQNQKLYKEKNNKLEEIKI